MSEGWKALRKKNEREDAAREEEEQARNHYFLYVIPALPASFMLTFSDEAVVDVVTQVQALDWLRDYVGSVIVAYIVVIAYFMLIGFLEFAFYRPLSAIIRLIVAWMAWAWFYYSTWVLDDLRYAFFVLFVISLFVLRIVGVLLFCYEKIRDGMFLRRKGDT